MRILTLLCLLFLNACVSRQIASTWETDEVRGKRVIVFIPGFYGSALADEKTGERVFQTFGQGLWGGIPLALAKPDLGVPDARPLKVDGVLGAVNVIPGLYSLDGYGGSVEFLKDEYGRDAKIVPFAYDWRQDNYLAIKALAATIRDLERDGARSVTLVAHSMGGIIASYYLRYGDADFLSATENWEGARHVTSVVIAGTPFGGADTAFHNLFNGTSVGLAKRPLNALSLSTFPAMYQLVPPKRLLAVEEWRQRRSGFFQDEPSPDLRRRREEYLAWCLTRAMALKQRLAMPMLHPPAKKVPLLLIVGTGEETPSPFEKSADGDGLVARLDAQLPPAYEQAFVVEKMEMAMEHRGMYVRRDVQERVRRFLAGREK